MRFVAVFVGGILVAQPLALAVEKDPFETAQAICTDVLDALRATHLDCVQQDNLGVHRCGTTGYDARTVQRRIDSVLRIAQREGIAISDSSWHAVGRTHLLNTSVDDITMRIRYAEDTGTISLRLDRPLVWCETIDRELESKVLTIREDSPLYPELAKAARIEARVEVEVRVSLPGDYPELCVRSTSKPNLGFEDCARAAAEKELQRDQEYPDASFVFEVWFELSSQSESEGTDSPSNA